METGFEIQNKKLIKLILKPSIYVNNINVINFQ